MLTRLIDYIDAHEDWLMERILKYAQQREYTKYTSTLKEAWRLSISGLSESLIELLKTKGDDIELGPEEDYNCDPAACFGRIEARRHRERGIPIDMFLGLMKYYHQSYQDLIKESPFSVSEKQHYSNAINRFFDRVEISFCTLWVSPKQGPLVEKLQNRNRQMTNEKNKYLTIFESLSMPVFIVAPDGKIENMNLAASNIFDGHAVPGSKYYRETPKKIVFTEVFSCLTEMYNAFVQGKEEKVQGEKFLETRQRYVHVSLSRSLDVSGKFFGTSIIMEDITARKKLENALEILATTDPLTGARNRRSFLDFFEQEHAKSQRYGTTFALLILDIDHFKKVNDTYGHDMGDNVLKRLVTEAQGTLRSSDIFGRWGGEEFVVLLPESSIHKAKTVAEKLRINLSRLEIVTDKGTCIQFTVSIGMTLVENSSDLLDDVITKADKALYLAKNQGRNQVVMV